MPEYVLSEYVHIAHSQNQFFLSTKVLLVHVQICCPDGESTKYDHHRCTTELLDWKILIWHQE